MENTKNTYFSRQIFCALNQFAVIIYLGFIAYNGHYIESNYLVHFLSLSLLFFDAAYISYKNVKCNKVLNHFSLLLLLLGWQFLLYLFDFQPISKAVSMLLLPFFTAYQLQFFISTLALAVVGIIQRKRIVFVLKSQRKRLLFPLTLVVIPFVIYLFVFHREAEYMASMGSYIPVMLAFVCIHSIVFQYHPQQVQFLTLSGGYIVALVFVGLVGLVGMAYLFQIPLMAILMSVYIVVLLAQVYNILLYVRICRQPTNYNNPTDRQHFYAYSLEQIKREENLKKDFSNYLHDNILQNLLSIKNMLCKAEQPEIRRLLLDTLTELNASIRFQMQTYHPNLVKSLTLKENIQNLLDSMEENHSANICLDCDKDVFLVEPYNVLIYRMIKELVTNALKHSSATTIDVLLMQEDGRITLKVTDNGIGFKPFTYKSGSHQGLASIGEQVSLLDGTMNIQPATGGGTAVVISMPMNGGDSYENFVGR